VGKPGFAAPAPIVTREASGAAADRTAYDAFIAEFGTSVKAAPYHREGNHLMPYYKYQQYLRIEQGPEFDALHQPAQATPFSGIYRCEVCGLSVTSVTPHPLPPQNHHQHQNAVAPIRWRLVVKSHFR